MENCLMIVRGEISPDLREEIQELYRFLILIQGNYRNAMHVGCVDGNEYMLTTDCDAKPVLYPISKYHKLTGELPSKDEMLGMLNGHSFEVLYHKWFLWNIDGGCKCGVCEMYKYQKNKERRCKRQNEKE